MTPAPNLSSDVGASEGARSWTLRRASAAEHISVVTARFGTQLLPSELVQARPLRLPEYMYPQPSISLSKIWQAWKTSLHQRPSNCRSDASEQMCVVLISSVFQNLHVCY